MSVHQTRAYFEAKYNGVLVDNPKVGEELRDVYWRPGNSEQFLDLVKKLTGKPLTGDALVASISEPVETLITREKEVYAKAVREGPKYKVGEKVDLEMEVRFVHGDLVVSETGKDGGLLGACKKYKEWIATL